MAISLSPPTQPSSAPDAAPEPRRGTGARRVLGAVAAAYLALLGTLLCWAMLPMLWGWSTFTVASDSMAPSLRAGDALVTSVVAPEQIDSGHIVVVDDPGTPGRLLSHRVVEVRADGELITRGDANAQADSTPVAPEAVRGVARARVPYVGLPGRWVARGEYAALAGWLLLTAAAVALAATDPHRRGRRPRRLVRLRRLRRPLRPVPVATVLILATPLGAAGVGAVVTQDGHLAHAAMSGQTANGSNALAAAPDFVAPTATRAVIAKSTTGYLAGSVQPSGGYRVYAQVSDTGSPASGVASVEADVQALTAGPVWTAMPSGSFTLQGLGYNYGSAVLTASTSAGSKGYSLRMTDAAGNARTTTGYTVTVDGTAPQATAVETVNSGTANRPTNGDQILLDFSEQIDPFSVLSGWTGASQTINVTLTNSAGTLVTFQQSLGGAQLPLGSIQFTNAYTSGTRTYASSTMVQSGSRITITLGGSAGNSLNTVAAASTGTWTPNTASFDAAGNGLSAAAATEPGPADADF